MNIYRSTGGLTMSVPEFFKAARKHPELLPDVIFDRERSRKHEATTFGYRCVFEQTGPTRASPPDGFIVRGNTYQFISVRNALARAVLGKRKTKRVARWTQER